MFGVYVHAAVNFHVAFWHDLWCLKLLLLFDATDDDDVPDNAELAICVHTPLSI